jgi:hypothetical protein
MRRTPIELNLLIEFLVLTAMSVSSVAQLIDCTMPGSPDEYKIYVDDVRFPGSNVPPRLRSRAQYLRTALFNELSNSWQDHASVKLCDRRFPNDAAEFDDTQVGSLNNLRVVLEVWTAIDDVAAADGEFGFVLVPERSILPPAVFVVRDRFQGDVNSILRRNKELQAFAPIVLGTRLYQNQSYINALQFLCEGHTQLQSTVLRQGSGPNSQLLQRERDLLAKLDTVIDDSYKQAKASGEPQFSALTPDLNGQYTCPK